MKTAPVGTLRNNYAKLLRRGGLGESITVTRRGKAVAKLVPMETTPPAQVDWARSAAWDLTSDDTPLTAEESTQLIRGAQGDW